MAIDRAEFAEECVRQGVFFGIEPHYLLAVAQLRSGISSDDDSDRKGALCNPAVRGTMSASSQSFRSNDNFVKLDGPALGAVTVFWRISPNSGKGHVGFYRGETSESVYVLGGNEGDMVQIEPMSKNQLIGYWWPRSINPPAVGRIPIPPGTPRHLTTKVT